VEGKPSTSECQALLEFDDDSPEEARQDIIDAVSYFFTFIAKGHIHSRSCE
jgi:hypothetical protein